MNEVTNKLDVPKRSKSFEAIDELRRLSREETSREKVRLAVQQYLSPSRIRHVLDSVYELSISSTNHNARMAAAKTLIELGIGHTKESSTNVAASKSDVQVNIYLPDNHRDDRDDKEE